MTPKQLSHLRSFLQERQSELESLLRNSEVTAVHSNDDMVDQIQHIPESNIAIANRRRESLQLGEVRGALQRIKLGTFGACVGCDEKISIKLLNALPWATSCLACRESIRPLADAQRHQRPLFNKP